MILKLGLEQANVFYVFNMSLQKM